MENGEMREAHKCEKEILPYTKYNKSKQNGHMC